MSDEPQTPPVPLAARAEVVSTLLEEYRQLYMLVLYRLQVLDQRIPLAAAALTATLGGVVVVPASLQIALLVGIPISVVLLFQSTLNHARSLEDVLTRISQIESAVNERLGFTALVFQSTHPGRNEIGGRTARETADAVLLAALLLIAWCAVLSIQLIADYSTWYAAWCVITAVALLHGRHQLNRYHYSDERPLAASADRR